MYVCFIVVCYVFFLFWSFCCVFLFSGGSSWWLGWWWLLVYGGGWLWCCFFSFLWLGLDGLCWVWLVFCLYCIWCGSEWLFCCWIFGWIVKGVCCCVLGSGWGRCFVVLVGFLSCLEWLVVFWGLGLVFCVFVLDRCRVCCFGLCSRFFYIYGSWCL